MIKRKPGTYRFTPKWALTLSQTNFSDRYNRAFYKFWPKFPDYGTRKIRGLPVKRIIPLGTHCMTADLLKSVDLRREAYPFDWMLMPPQMITECLDDDFDTLFDHQFISFPACDRDGSVLHAIYEGMGAPEIFSHVKTRADIDKLKDRASRFRERCAESIAKPILFVMIVRHCFDVADNFGPLIRALSLRASKFQLLCVQLEEPRGRGETSMRLIREESGHRLYNFSPISDESRLGYFPDPLDGVNILRLVENYHFEIDG